jgi:thymidylate synthase ThyX
MLEKVKKSPFIPIAFQKDHSGMQGTEYLEGVDLVDAVEAWQDAALEATLEADNLSRSGVTKQICNRLLEPFLYHTVIATASNWQNFFALRAHEAAEIHIADLAHKMLNIYNSSEPQSLKFGDWHIPFGDRMSEILSEEQKRMVAVSRAARVSYDNFDGPSSLEKDYALYKRLSEMGHWSPFEHVAQAAENSYIGQGGNLDDSWLQLRKTFAYENKTDPRVKK